MTGPLSATQIDNLAVLARVWGFVKYHHPKVATGTLDWDAELIRAMPSILDAADTAGRNAALFSWLQSVVGEPAPCNPCASAPTDPYMPAAINWIHDTSLLGDSVSAYLERVYDNRFAGGNQFYVSLGTGAANAVFNNEATYAQMTLPNGGYRLLALFRLWNMIEYLYPYRDVIGEPWEGVLTDSLRTFYEAGSRDDYARALLELFARINDTHANLWNGLASVLPPQGACALPVGIRFIEDQATVSAYGNPQLGPASGLQIGDVILTIDGNSVDSLVAEWTPYYPASNEPTRLRNIARFMTRGACQATDLKVQRGPDLLDLTVERIPIDQMDPQLLLTHDRPGATFQLLAPDVAYLKLSSATQADSAQYIADAQGTAGLIIDLRNYPNEFVVFTLGDHLVSQPTEFARFTIPDLRNPGAFVWGPSATLQPVLPHYDGKVAILVDEITQSQAEYTTMAFRSAPNAVVIGSTTAGADGNVSSIPLPGGMGGAMTGIGVFYPDKSPTQRIGIIPDIVVSPTIDGIGAGSDELLDRAVDWIRGIAPTATSSAVPSPKDSTQLATAAGAMKTSQTIVPNALSAKPGGRVLQAAAGSEETTSPEPALSNAVPRAVAELGDFNGDNRTDIAVLARDPAAACDEVDVLDVSNGTVLARLPLSRGVAKAFLVAPDLNGDSIGEPTVLLGDTLRAEVKDATSAQLLGDPSFDSAFSPIAFLSVGDADGDTIPDLALVGRGVPGGAVQVEVKSTTGNRLISRFEFNERCERCKAVVVDDVGDSAAREIALVGVDAAGRVAAEVRDALTGARVGHVYFDGAFEPVAVAALPDGSGKLTYLGVLGRNAAGALRAQIRHVTDGALLSDIDFDPAYEPEALLGFADSNGDRSGEIAVLGVDSNGAVLAEVKEMKDGTTLRRIAFDPGYRPLGAIAVKGVAGQGRNAIAVLGESFDEQRYRLEIRDLSTGAAVGTSAP